MIKKVRALEAIKRLKELYPDAACSLETVNPLQLLIATRLAAQCTDARVNLVTPVLFERFPDLDAFVQADAAEVEEIIKSCGLYKTKARDIRAMCRMLAEQYNGVIPDTVEELIKLPGVGRKTANLIVGEVFHKPAVITDTHCIRLSNRIGLVTSRDPLKVERELRALLPPEESAAFCHCLVYHGRAMCTARGPRCGECTLADICVFGAQKLEDIRRIKAAAR